MKSFREASMEWQSPQASVSNSTAAASRNDQDSAKEQDNESRELPASTDHPEAEEEETLVKPSVGSPSVESPDRSVSEVVKSTPEQSASQSVRRPIRNRRPPARYLTFLVPFFIFLLGPSINQALVLRENAIFKEQADVAFSESSWTIVTDLDFGPADVAITYLKQKILQQQEVVEKWKNQGS